jgi:hypothetical protein
MLRVVISLILGVIVGIAVGLYLGWVQFPVEYVNSPAPDLAQRYKDEYTVMVADGYLADRDSQGAIARLRVLGVQNVPEYVQNMAERFISTSRDVDDIRVLVALSEGLGRTSPIFEPYRLMLGQS